MLLTFSCVEKGCKDESALNYNITASVDDGSCIYCQKDDETFGTVNFHFVDFATPIHVNDSVLFAEAIQTKVVYNDGGCGIGGCSVSIKLTNLVHSDIRNLRVYVYFQIQGGFGFSYQNPIPVDIKEGESIILDDILVNTNANCLTLNGAIANSSIININYQ